jgi:WD40 repeat protein
MLRVRFRYDIFISYARGDGAAYAKQLRDRLKELDFTAFLDEAEITPGDPLRASLEKALERSATFVIVGTPRAASSSYIAMEVKHFAETGRRIIPINIGGSITEPPWAAVQNEELVWIDDSSDSLTHGVPGLHVVTGIESFFEYRKRNSVRRLQAMGVALLFVAMVIAAVFVIARQIGKLEEQESWSRLREQRAKRERGLLDKTRKDLNEQTRIAREQTRVAAENSRTADERLIDITHEQGRFELLRGNRAHALVSLAAVYRERPNDRVLRSMVAAAARAVVIETLSEKPLVAACWSRDRRHILTVSQLSDYDPRARQAEETCINKCASDLSLRLLCMKRCSDELPREAILRNANGQPVATLSGPLVGGDRAAFTTADQIVLPVAPQGMSVWSASNGQHLRDLRGLAGVKVGAFLSTPDGTRLLVSSKGDSTQDSNRLSTTAYLVDLVSGRLVRQLPGGLSNCCANDEVIFMSAEGMFVDSIDAENSDHVIFMSGDGRLAGTIDTRNTVRLFTTRDGEEIQSFDDEEYTSAALSPDGTTIALASHRQKQIVLRDVESKTQLACVEMGDGGQALSLTFSPDGTNLAVAKGGGRFAIWAYDLASEKWKSKLSPSRSGTRPGFSPDGQRIAALDANGYISVYDVETNEQLDRLSHPDRLLSFEFSRDGTGLFSGCADGVRIWDAARDGRLKTPFRSVIDHPYALTPDGRHLIVVSNATATRYETLTGNQVGRAMNYTKTTTPIQSVVVRVSDDGHWAVVSDKDHHDAFLIDFNDGSSHRIEDPDDEYAIEDPDDEYAISDDGEWLAFKDLDGVALISGAVEPFRIVIPNPVLVRFAPGRPLILVASSNQEIVVADPKSRKILKRTTGCTGAISPDGAWAVIIDCEAKGRSARILSLRDARQDVPLNMRDVFYEDDVAHHQIAFSDDSQVVAIAPLAGPLRIWSVPDGSLLHTLENDEQHFALDFDPSGERLASAAWASVTLWDVRRGSAIGVLGMIGGPIQGIRFVGNGDHLAGFTGNVNNAPDVISRVTIWMTPIEMRNPETIARLVERDIPREVRAAVNVALQEKLQRVPLPVQPDPQQ